MDTTASHKPHLKHTHSERVIPLNNINIIGRHEDCDIVLKNERGASRKHARITVQDNIVMITDLGSLNGTLVNNEQLEQSRQLKHGDSLVFDEQVYECVIPEFDGDNDVTIIANKAEIGRPDLIQPAIKIIDESNHDFTSAIPATSRPGGDAKPTKRRRNVMTLLVPSKRALVLLSIVALLLALGICVALLTHTSF